MKLPFSTFDIGSFELNQSEIILFGGFNDGALDKVLSFKIPSTASAEGDIQVVQSSKLG